MSTGLFDEPKAPREPTSDECQQNARVDLGGGQYGTACWYPQMGGYCGKAVMVIDAMDEDDQTPCFEVWVWHDGEFPFAEDDPKRGQPPRHLHHCQAEQFIEFGELAVSLSRIRRDERDAEDGDAGTD